ncbi:hypothetical protein P5673_033064 [Acropora cervicornis]|uniref:YqaJ viral recombinase domain-containing protein n=1 Tax=Acropora cervicornis TaxID=6130 RepID=A0AAD9URJ6_ACRCE|nr:hypothetical protein P5673_033064 [Acropora cervicornis]
MSSGSFLEERDIPGASLCGRKPSELKNVELKFWLRCRGDPGKGFKTKAELVKRVEEYIKTGKDKHIVDPDPNGLYTKRKQQRIGIGAASSVTDGDPHNKERLTVDYPTDGWSTSLEKMPMFTRAEMNEHIARSGKNISDIQNHSVPTSLKKAKTSLEDEYLREINAASARKQPHYVPANEASLKSELAIIDPNMGFAHLHKCINSSQTTQTKYGETPVGSLLSYQVSFTESNFSAEADLTVVPRNDVLYDNITSYPRFPLSNENPMVTPQELSTEEAALLLHLSVDEDKVNTIEASTREQSESEIWKKERTYRFTSSIAKRQRNHAAFAHSIMHPKPFTSKYVAHEYEKFMFSRKTPVAVLKSGFVVSQAFPVLGASPDAKVIDFGCSICFGLAEVKCPHTKFHVTPLEPCSDPNFFMEKLSEGKCRLKRDHAYYAQVQGQIGVTGAKWCDFITYTSKGIYIERIAFNPAYWENLKTELLRYYFEHFLKFASADFNRSA